MDSKDDDYVVLFVDNENGESVHAEEVKEIDFVKVLSYLNLGGSVFITNKKLGEKKTKQRLRSKKQRLLLD